ncbi:hypothetical protein FSP39_005567 [Pinctada imbricata]|uniref:Metal-dependent HD superfamily phosphohydrolase n=1 Tax=Pinctada imbricata TaxID=66713 RepID=A0AA89BPZ0_PINIB|nr:hypothetical protein FSP39_005567 [Pinctada imbricata]
MNFLVETAWDFVTKELSIGKEIASRWLTEIKRRYGEPQRHYHTLQHIEDMLALYEQYKDTVQRPCLVLLAIFFHDIIYDPTKPDNEEKSAELFDEFASEVKNLTTDHTKLVRKWILDTKDHHVIADSTEDVHLFMDIDMAILGTKDQVYDDYAEKIRSEYCHYKDEDFNKGRAKVLRGFRTHPRIYSTPIFYERFEEDARKNIDREIHRLESLLQEDSG